MAPTANPPHPLRYLEYLLCKQTGVLMPRHWHWPNKGKRIKGTNTLFSIPYDMIPANRRREITYSKFVCKV